MKIDSTVAGWRVSAIVPSMEERDVFYVLGSNPGNKRPEYAVIKITGNAAGHGSTKQVQTVYSSHEWSAADRRDTAMRSVLHASGWADSLVRSLVTA